MAVVAVHAALELELAMALARAGVTQMTRHVKLLMHQHLQDQIGKLRQGRGAAFQQSMLYYVQSMN